MRYTLAFAALAATASAVTVFLNEPDTGLEEFLGADFPVGQLPDLDDIVSVPDFDFAARNYMNQSSYNYYRSGTAGEWSYRNNLDAFGQVRLRTSVLNDVSKVGSTMTTSILGQNFSAPFFIAPAAKAGLGHPDAEENLIKGAAIGGVLYIPSLDATLSIQEIGSYKNSNQTTWQQIYDHGNLANVKKNIQLAEAAGSKAIVLTVDGPAAGVRTRAARYGLNGGTSDIVQLTWDVYAQIQNMTKLPVIPKGITTVDDLKKAIAAGAKAVYLSNHGGRKLDSSPSPLEICLEIYETDPTLFQKIEVYADGGVRYGTDVLKLLAFGVKAVGLGRSFMYANAYGVSGITHLIDIMKNEVIQDAANLGITDIHKIDISRLNLKPLIMNGF